MKVRIAVAPRANVFDPVELTELIDGLESRRFDTIWLSDVPLTPAADPGIALAYAAARTRRLKLGANIVPLGRNPFLLAKQLAQLDRLSDGRILISLVPGLAQPGERETLGVTNVNRGRYLDMVIPLLRRWWAGEAVEAGVTYRRCPFTTPSKSGSAASARAPWNAPATTPTAGSEQR